MKKYQTLKDFYWFYLTEHSNKKNRMLHFIGTFLVILVFLTGFFSANYRLLLIIPFLGYAFAWVGHFFIEKNRPATFQYPLYSLASDFIMFWHILTNQINHKLIEAHKKIKADL